MKTKILAALLAFAVQSASAIVLTHGADGDFSEYQGVYADSYDSFDRAEFHFQSEYADTITISNIAPYSYVHDHGTEALAELQVFNGSNWTTVGSYAVPSDTLLSSLFSNPVSFIGMDISGLRLNTEGYVGYMFHDVDYNMQYTTSGTAVPEPATTALVGLGLLGFVASRRKLAKSKPE